MFGKKKELCACEQKRRRGTCRQCVNRLEEELRKAKEAEASAVRIYTSIDGENEILQKHLASTQKELDSIRKFREGTTKKKEDITDGKSHDSN